jgi:hypothetical protein
VVVIVVVIVVGKALNPLIDAGWGTTDQPLQPDSKT